MEVHGSRSDTVVGESDVDGAWTRHVPLLETLVCMFTVSSRDTQDEVCHTLEPHGGFFFSCPGHASLGRTDSSGRFRGICGLLGV